MPVFKMTDEDPNSPVVAVYDLDATAAGTTGSAAGLPGGAAAITTSLGGLAYGARFTSAGRQESITRWS